MTRWIVVGSLLVVAMALCVAGCKSEPKLLYSYDFNSGTLGDEWRNEGGDWKIVDGKLVSKRARNKDLVLTKPLPKEGIIELEMISHSPQVDVKFRAWGDKRDDMHDGAYHFILGGWGNKISTIAPLGEHDKRRVTRKSDLAPDTMYKIKLTRKDGVITLFVDGNSYLAYTDSDPLDPEVFKYFSFANWESDCAFDNLKIYAYDD